MNNQLNYDFYYWGPYLVKFKITEKEKLVLQSVGRQTTEDFRHQLAGIIKDEKLFNKKNTNWFMDYFSDYFKVYMEGLQKYNQQQLLKQVTELEVGKVWINYMKANEFNPPHIHSGDLSFVIYLEIPEQLKKEREEYKGTSAGPGAIQFTYGEANPTNKPSCFATHHAFVPEEGDFFIFPANLQHCVFPFKCDGTRTSVAGNIYYKFNDSI
jgi:hypothetical protein